MTTAANPGTSDQTTGDENGFFSSIRSFFGQASSYANDIGTAASNVRNTIGTITGSNAGPPPIFAGAGGGGRSDSPTYQGAASNTTGTSVTGTPTNYTPIILGGIAVVALIFLLK